MKIRILKGTNQIGGCITEIISLRAKIIIDFGEDLPNENNEIFNKNPMIDGLTVGKKNMMQYLLLIATEITLI